MTRPFTTGPSIPTMKNETYKPGHGDNATRFMARRTLESHGAFFVPHLRTGLAVLDLACGPSTITTDLARIAAPATVTGIDMAEAQLEAARTRASDSGVRNLYTDY